MSNGDVKKKCFVVMGFGTKTDLATGRAIDLDKVYKNLIKPVVVAKGIDCVRADEITHSGVIDVPMYEQLLGADLVIADISTANPNAIYELGIRHALKPYTTIVMSENRLKYPFDLNHILITSYNYLDGGGIDFDEVVRFRDVLGKMIDELMREPKADSPVYTFLGDLLPPSLKKQIAEAAAAGAKGGFKKKGMAFGMAGASPLEAIATPAAAPVAVPTGPSLSELMEQAERAMRSDDFNTAKDKYGEALKLIRAKQKDGEPIRAEDPYLIQRLALATYKSKQPTDAATVKALNEALKLLAPLKPAESNDPETVGLAGAIEKRLFEKDQKVDHLARAIKYYFRGYCLRDDYYNGINLAYLLNVRADTSLDPTDADRTADVVVANRTRREVLALCDRELKAIQERRKRQAGTPGPTEVDGFLEDQQASDHKQHFWCLATKAEAYFGLGEAENYKKTRAQAEKLKPPPAPWMIETFDGQIGRLRSLLEKYAHLLNPPWTMP